MNRFRTILVLIILVGFNAVKGQQMPQYTQYMFNEFVINPAITGTENYYQIRTNHRFQWVGFVDPPITNSISFYGPDAKYNMGYGGYVYNDVTGPTSRTGITGAYAYNIGISSDLRLSMGISASIMQYRIDGTQLNPKDVSDPSILQVVSTSYLPDAGVGLYLYAEDYYVGFSVAQLLNNKLNIFDNRSGFNRLKSHFNLVGGYRFQVDQDWILEPSAMIKGTAPREFTFDISARTEWKKMVWAALSYRYHEAICMLIGYSFEETLYFGYAYDIGITDLRKYNTGTHEIMIGYRFNAIK